MAFQALGWLQKTIGIDITGEAEYEEHKTTVLHKKGDEPTPEISEEELRNELKKAADDTEARREKRAAREHGDGRHHHHHKRRQSSGEKIVTVAPNKVYFPIPLDKFIMNTLIASNTTETFVQFKMKATAPSRYAVKPRQGVLGPKEQIEIHVTLRPTKEEPSEMRDKFLIESRVMTAEEVEFYQRTGDIQTLWRTKKEGTVGSKIKCKFTAQLPPNFIVKSVVETAVDDDDLGQSGEFFDHDDDDEEGEILPDTPAPAAAVTRQKKKTVCADEY